MRYSRSFQSLLLQNSQISSCAWAILFFQVYLYKKIIFSCYFLSLLYKRKSIHILFFFLANTSFLLCSALCTPIALTSYVKFISRLHTSFFFVIFHCKKTKVQLFLKNQKFEIFFSLCCAFLSVFYMNQMHSTRSMWGCGVILIFLCVWAIFIRENYAIKTKRERREWCLA